MDEMSSCEGWYRYITAPQYLVTGRCQTNDQWPIELKRNLFFSAMTADIQGSFNLQLIRASFTTSCAVSERGGSLDTKSEGN